MDWTILGIAPTDDKKAITAAYRAKLKTTNPEEKPEQFKALRAAYEEALRLAEQPQAAPERDESPLGLWMERLAGIYSDFSRRIDPGCWKELLSDDIWAGLDSRPLAEEALMNFLMEHYVLPNAVWKTLDEALSLRERAEELCEVYPRQFIEQCILIGIRFEQGIHLELFEPGRNGEACDTYRELYYQCLHNPPEQREELLDRMESLPEQHPYGRALRFLWMIDNGREEQGRAGFRDLAQRYPDEPRLTLDHANLCLRAGETDEAEAICRRVLEANPLHQYAKRTLAECQAASGDLVQAKETLYDLMHAAGDDPVLMDQLGERIRVWNTDLIRRYEAALAEDPADSNSAVELAWCHIQSECPDQAMDVALKIDPDTADPFDYNNLMGKLYHNIEMYDRAAEHMANVVSILRAMVSDGTEKTEKRIRRLPEMLQILGNSLLHSGREAEGRAVLSEAMELAPDDPKILTLMSNIHYSAGEYEACIDVMCHLTEVSPGSWFAHLMQALCFYKLRRDREAFESLDRAMSLHGTDLSMFILRMQILLRNGVFDEVREILKFLHEEGAPEDLALDFIRAQLLELEDKDEQAAFRSYQSIARKVEDGDTLLDAPLLYFRMAAIMGRQSKSSKKEDHELLISVLDKGLAHDPNDADCLDYKAWLLQRLGRLDEAIAMYQKLTTPQARRRLADLYFEDLNAYGAQALAIYEELLSQRQTPELCFYAAASAKSLGDLQKTERYCDLALSLDPGDIDAHRIIGQLREAEGNNDASLAHLDKAIASMWENELFYDWLIGHKVRVLRRMNRHADALALIDDAMSRAEYSGYELKFEICCQFGLWNQAEAVLAQWAAAEQGNPEITKATGRLHLLRGKMLKATFAYAKVKHQMDAEEELDLRIQLADLEANNKRLIQLWTQRLEDHPDRVNALMNCAFALRLGGNAEKAKAMAVEALKQVDEILTTYHTDETLHRTRRSLLLMLAGREEEARAELALARRKPLCQHCSYCSCKDADIFEAFLEELAGNHAKARALYQAGHKNWPDELDFVSGETRMKKKKGK